MILGSIVLVLALSAVVIAVLQLRQGRRERRSNDATIESQADSMELGGLGWLLTICRRLGKLTCNARAQRIGLESLDVGG